jgi:AraC-like DNA-binding protein
MAVGGFAVRELLPGHPVARASDLDEARDAVTRVYLPHRLEMVGSAVRLGMRLNAVRVGDLTVGYLQYDNEVRLVTSEANHFHVNIPLAGHAVSRCGTYDPVHATPGHAAVFMPDSPADIRWGAGCAQLCLMISRAGLETELVRLLGRPLTEPLRFATDMDLTTPYARAWRHTLDLLEDTTTATASPLAAAHLEALVVHGLLLAQPHNYVDALGAAQRPAQPRPVRRAVELMRNRPQEPWTSASLAEQVAVSVRSLQEGFQRSLGMPPMVYLRELRLDHVHAELAAGDPDGPTVSAVGQRWGFPHAGRFAAAYKRKFGRSPSETLRNQQN